MNRNIQMVKLVPLSCKIVRKHVSELDEMSNYPVRAAVFLLLLFIAAVVTVFLQLVSGIHQQLDPLSVFIWSLLGVINESFSVHDRRGNIYISTVEAVFFAAYLAGGTLTALVCIAATTLLSVRKVDGRLRHLLNSPFRLTLFNTSHFFIALPFVDAVYRGLVSLSGGLTILPAFLAAPVFFLVSCVLNALFYYFEEGRRFLHYLVQVFRPFYVEAAIASSGAVIIALTFPRFGILSAVFFITPIIMARLTFLERAA